MKLVGHINCIGIGIMKKHMNSLQDYLSIFDSDEEINKVMR